MDIKDHTPCATNLTVLHERALALSRHHHRHQARLNTSNWDIYSDLLSTHKLCETLFNKRVTGDTFGAYLRRSRRGNDAMMRDAVKLLAASYLTGMSILDSPVLLMTINSLHELESWYDTDATGVSHRVWLTDFPTTDIHKTTATIKSIYDFLMKPTENSRNFWNGSFPIEKAVERGVRRYVATTTAKNPVNTAHFTYHSLSEEAKKLLLISILQDSVLGRLYRLMSSIVNRRREDVDPMNETHPHA